MVVILSAANPLCTYICLLLLVLNRVMSYIYTRNPIALVLVCLACRQVDILHHSTTAMGSLSWSCLVLTYDTDIGAKQVDRQADKQAVNTVGMTLPCVGMITQTLRLNGSLSTARRRRCIAQHTAARGTAHAVVVVDMRTCRSLLEGRNTSCGSSRHSNPIELCCAVPLLPTN
ncbi:hypothetical protein F5Y09DRAFT_50232 [Xylaria sp. FL1042]|nr:hypothetical protein F5Y09DRAFT_50232 [Xylaria sp. FL1042]